MYMPQDMKDELESKTWKQVIVENVPIPDKTDEEHRRDFNLLIQNIQLLISNSNLIIKKPEYYHIRMRRLHLGTMLTGMTGIFTPKIKLSPYKIKLIRTGSASKRFLHQIIIDLF